MTSPFVGSTAVAGGLLTRGQLRWNYTAIHPDVYIPKDSERTLDVRARAAALWVPDGIVTGRAAAALHGASWMPATRTSFAEWTTRSVVGDFHWRDLHEGREFGWFTALVSISARFQSPSSGFSSSPTSAMPPGL
ncbi:hypothetical protein ACTXG7_05965 [Mycolicibacterium sp. Dal123E01]|uniref:hypothetical protein n=1 Tax=Mycolicibacterium sp. Dal123E01 TaxID=3457578 RepID=UPI00403EB0BD